MRFVRFATAGRGRGRSVSQSYRRLIACAGTVRWRAKTSTRALDGWVEDAPTATRSGGREAEREEGPEPRNGAMQQLLQSWPSCWQARQHLG